MPDSIPFYTSVAALSRKEHRKLRLKSVETFAFALGTNRIPMGRGEFIEMARYYPIVFGAEHEDGSGEINPVLLVGLEVGRNDYVSSTGHWAAGVPLPA
jgi:hypothetical protein